MHFALRKMTAVCCNITCHINTHYITACIPYIPGGSCNTILCNSFAYSVTACIIGVIDSSTIILGYLTYLSVYCPFNTAYALFIIFYKITYFIIVVIVGCLIIYILCIICIRYIIMDII